jgi:glyoxylase-like metal-dependent hydrolase (beta-lactamase superfamily II)
VSQLCRPVLNHIWAFPPNRETLGGTAYLIVENSRNILIDCPPWTDATRAFLAERGGVDWLVITHRQGMNPEIVRQLQLTLHCQILIQEQEAYLLPDATVQSFEKSYDITETCRAIWTPGYSPGASCVYSAREGGVLFTGRHLLPDQFGDPKPLRTAKTFHWPRQLRNVRSLLLQYTPDTLTVICPGANVGFLRGKTYIEQAYQKLQQLDLTAMEQLSVGV